MGDRDPAAHSDRERSQGLRGGAGGLQIRGRSPWIATDAAAGASLGRTSPLTAAPAVIRPASTGTAAKEMISSRRGSRPVVSTSTATKRAVRHEL
jgi:hypothetical protein